MKKNYALFFSLIFSLGLLTVSFPLLAPSSVMAAPDAGDAWTTPVNISMIDGNPLGLAWSKSALAVDSNGYIHAVYYQRNDLASYNYEVYYVTNTGGSWSWANISQVNHTSVNQYYPVIGVDSSNVAHIVYYGYTTTGGDRDLFYCNNAGGTWSTPYNITQNQGTTEDIHHTMVIDSQNNIHIAYHDDTNQKVSYVSRSSAGVWSTPVNVTYEFYDIYDQMAIDLDSSNNVYIVFAAYNTTLNNMEIYLVNNTGGSWGALVDVSQNADPIRDYYPSMSIDRNNHIHVAWEYYDTPDNGLAYKVFNGTAWSAQVFANATNYTLLQSSLVTDYDGNAHITFTQYDGSDNEVYYVNNTQGSFGIPVNVTADSGNELNTFIALDNQGYAHIIFHNGTAGYIQYLKSTLAVGSAVPGDILPIIIIVAVVVVVVVVAAAFYLLRIRKPGKP